LKVLTGAGAQIDTTTSDGRLAFGVFAAFAEFERELIAERTMAGLAAARARGRMGGRPRKMDRSTLMMAMPAMADRKAIASNVAVQLGLTRNAYDVRSLVEQSTLSHRKSVSSFVAISTRDDRRNSWTRCAPPVCPHERHNDHASSCMISRSSQRPCVDAQITCVGGSSEAGCSPK
jgi:hypothetical protein